MEMIRDVLKNVLCQFRSQFDFGQQTKLNSTQKTADQRRTTPSCCKMTWHARMHAGSLDRISAVTQARR